MLFKDTDHFFVTGASSGIGLAIGQAIIKNGGIVVGIARIEIVWCPTERTPPGTV